MFFEEPKRLWVSGDVPHETTTRIVKLGFQNSYRKDPITLVHNGLFKKKCRSLSREGLFPAGIAFRGVIIFEILFGRHKYEI